VAVAFARNDNSNGSSTSASVFFTSAAAGHLMVAIVHVASAAAVGSFTWPSGWTSSFAGVDNTSDGLIHSRTEIRWRIFQAGDPSFITVTVPAQTSGGWETKGLRYTGTDTTTPILDFGAGTNATDSASTAAVTSTLTNSTSNIWWMAYFRGCSVSANRTWTDVLPARSGRSPLHAIQTALPT
jgi:hypothetical protein